METANTLSMEWLVEHFGEKSAGRLPVVLTQEEAEEAEAKAKRSPNDALEYLNERLEFHGVCVVRDARSFDSYYGDAVEPYLNSGDSYLCELAYNLRSKTWIAGSAAERWEAGGREG